MNKKIVSIGLLLALLAGCNSGNKNSSPSLDSTNSSNGIVDSTGTGGSTSSTGGGTSSTTISSVDAAEKLARAKSDALDALKRHYESFDEDDFFDDKWLELVNIYETAKTAINNAETESAINSLFLQAKNDMNAVSKIDLAAEKLQYIELLSQFYDEFEEDDYATSDWGILYNYYVAGGNAIKDCTEYNQLDAALEAAKNNMNNVPTTDLAGQILLALAELDEFYNEFEETDYDSPGWAELVQFYEDAVTDITNAETVSAMRDALADAKTAMSSVGKSQLPSLRQAATEEIDLFYNRLIQEGYSQDDWASIDSLLATAKENIVAATSIEELEGLVAGFKSAVEVFPKILTVYKVECYNGFYIKLFINLSSDQFKQNANSITINSSTPSGIVYFPGSGFTVDFETNNTIITLWKNLTDISTIDLTLSVTFNLADNSTIDRTIKVSNGQLLTLDLVKTNAINELAAYPTSKGYDEIKYETSQWTTLQNLISSFSDDINNCISSADVGAKLSEAKAAIDAVPQKELGLEEIKVLAKKEIDDHAATKVEDKYTPENWSILIGIVQTAKDEIDAATSSTAIEEIVDIAKQDIDSVERASLWDVDLNASGMWNPHGNTWIQMDLKYADGSQISGVTGVVTLTHEGTDYAGTCDFARIGGQLFAFFSTFPGNTATATYTLVITFAKDNVRYGISLNIVNGSKA